MMRTFVTGGTGFIGGAVVRRLLEAGHEVKALVRPGADTQQLDGLPVEQVRGDLRDPESVRRGMAGCGWVFHVAALYSYWGYRWEDFYQTNVEGTRQALEAARDQGAERVVYTSSIAALGIHKDGSPANERTHRAAWLIASARINAPSSWPSKWPAILRVKACRWSSSTPAHR